MTQVAIRGFSGQHRFLSNFYPVEILIDGEIYISSEHYYMSQKTTDPILRRQIIECKTPGQAKRLGRSVVLREGWDEVHKLPTMLKALRHKFSVPLMRDMLEGTGDAYLEETNHWGDTFWGVCDGVGYNCLGHMLMRVRDENRMTL